MIDIKDAVVWTNRDSKTTMVWVRGEGRPEPRIGWSDPIGAAYTQWRKQPDTERLQLMLETALDLAMQGYPLRQVLTEFAKVKQFRAFLRPLLRRRWRSGRRRGRMNRPS